MFDERTGRRAMPPPAPTTNPAPPYSFDPDETGEYPSEAFARLLDAWALADEEA